MLGLAHQIIARDCRAASAWVSSHAAGRADHRDVRSRCGTHLQPAMHRGMRGSKFRCGAQCCVPVGHRRIVGKLPHVCMIQPAPAAFNVGATQQDTLPRPETPNREIDQTTSRRPRVDTQRASQKSAAAGSLSAAGPRVRLSRDPHQQGHCAVSFTPNNTTRWRLRRATFCSVVKWQRGNTGIAGVAVHPGQIQARTSDLTGVDDSAESGLAAQAATWRFKPLVLHGAPANVAPTVLDEPRIADQKNIVPDGAARPAEPSAPRRSRRAGTVRDP